MGAGRPLAGARGSAAARAPPRRPAAAATSGRALAAASPLARGPAATSGPAGTPRPVAGSAPRSLTRCASPRRPVPVREPRGSPEPLLIRRPWIRTPRCPFAPGSPVTRLGRATGSADGAAATAPRSAHVPSTCRARAAGARLRGAQPPVPTWRRRAAQVLQRRRPHLVFPTFRELN